MIPASISMHQTFTRQAVESVLRESFSLGNSLKLLASGPQAFDSIFDVLRQARRFICLEFYIVRSDETGQILSDFLCERATAGVRVWFKYDHFGSLTTPEAYWERLRRAGVEVRASRPFRFSSPFGYTRRNHRKLIVIDGIVSFTGGLNIGDEYRGLLHRKSPWRDTGIVMSGPISSRLLDGFRKSWMKAGGDPLPVETAPEKRKPEPGSAVVPIFTSSARERRRMRRLFYYSIRSAARSICLTTAYFTPSMRLVEALEEAVRRGVEVRLLLPGESDFRAPFHAGRHFFDRLLQRGVRIFEYQGQILHAKTAVFDGIWSVIGSANLDFRSLRRNDEGNVGVLDEDIGRQMLEIFEADLAHSRETRLEEWRKRPAWEKIQELFFSLFRRRL